MKRSILMLANDVNVNKGGINSVMFSRTHMFNNEQYTSRIVTLDDKINYPEIEQQLKEDGRLSAETSIINIYDFYRNKFSDDGVINEEMRTHYEKNMEREEPGYHYYLEGNTARYFDNGRYVKYKRWDEEGNLFVVDYFSTMRVRSIREEYHPDGYLQRKMTYHPSNNKITQMHYFTKEGFCYLSRWFNHKTDKIQRVILFSPDRQNAKVFLNNMEFHTYFLEELCDLEQQPPIFICDGPGSSSTLQKMTAQKAVRIYALHTNHLQEPYVLGGELKRTTASLLTNEDHEAPLVVLTNRQKIDIETQFSERPWNIHVISHALEAKTEPVEKTDNLIVVAGRYHKEKRLDLLIEAFNKVLDEVPDATLHLYGEGPEKLALQKLVKQLKIGKSVSIKGYTTEVNKKVAQALFTVNTSGFEGQGLVMLEAMAQKTPTISFKINYIVREVYDNSAGAVVENGNVDKLAEKMVDWLYNPNDTKALGQRAFEVIEENYKVKNQYRLWQQLFESEIARQLTAVE